MFLCYLKYQCKRVPWGTWKVPASCNQEQYTTPSQSELPYSIAQVLEIIGFKAGCQKRHFVLVSTNQKKPFLTACCTLGHESVPSWLRTEVSGGARAEWPWQPCEDSVKPADLTVTQPLRLNPLLPPGSVSIICLRKIIRNNSCLLALSAFGDQTETWNVKTWASGVVTNERIKRNRESSQIRVDWFLKEEWGLHPFHHSSKHKATDKM